MLIRFTHTHTHTWLISIPQSNSRSLCTHGWWVHVQWVVKMELGHKKLEEHNSICVRATISISVAYVFLVKKTNKKLDEHRVWEEFLQHSAGWWLLNVSLDGWAVMLWSPLPCPCNLPWSDTPLCLTPSDPRRHVVTTTSLIPPPNFVSSPSEPGVTSPHPWSIWEELFK